MNRSKPKKLASFVVFVAAAGFFGYLGGSVHGGASSASVEAGSFLDEIRARGELRVGVAPAPPISGTQPDGTLGGPSLVPLQLLADQLDVELVPVAAQYSTIVAGLQAGRFDVAANLDSTLERATAIQFSAGLYDAPAVFVVRADAPFSTAAEVVAAGPIAAAQGAAYVGSLEHLEADVTLIDSIPNALAALQAGRVVAEFVDLPSAVGQAQADPSVKIVVPDPVIYQSEAAYGLPEHIDARSKQLIDLAIAQARNSGALGTAFSDVGYRTVDQLGELAR
jgi:polar amino acid transport system substrate-binding protein